MMNFNVISLIFVILGVNAGEDGHLSFNWKYWKPGDHPAGAVAATRGNFIGRVYTWQGIILATVDFDREVATTIETTPQMYWDGVEILCAEKPGHLYWEDVSLNDGVSHYTYEHAIRGGFLTNTASSLYIGRVKLGSHYNLGMVVPSKNKDAGLWIRTADEGLKQFSEFELLKYVSVEMLNDM